MYGGCSAAELEQITDIRGTYAYTDDLSNLGPSQLQVATDSGRTFPLEIRSVADSVQWNMAHTAAPWDNWPYWRARIVARVADAGPELHGWFDASHYGASGPT